MGKEFEAIQDPLKPLDRNIGPLFVGPDLPYSEYTAAITELHNDMMGVLYEGPPRTEQRSSMGARITSLSQDNSAA